MSTARGGAHTNTSEERLLHVLRVGLETCSIGCDQSTSSLDGFVTIIRKRKRENSARNSGIEFVFENPARPGRLWTQPFMEALTSDVAWVATHTTSYCKYRSEYRKSTTFVTSLVDVKLLSECTPQSRCSYSWHEKRHATGVQGQPLEVKYSVPELLTRELVRAWVEQTPWAKERLFLDVFSGFGSVVNAVKGRADRHPEWNIQTWANDINSHVHLNSVIDMSLEKSLDMLLHCALEEKYPNLKLTVSPDSWGEYLFTQNTSVLIHLSTPCQTYSTASGNTHNDRNVGLAKEHDDMNTMIINWLRANSVT